MLVNLHLSNHCVALQIVVWVDPLDGTAEFTEGTFSFHFIFFESWLHEVQLGNIILSRGVCTWNARLTTGAPKNVQYMCSVNCNKHLQSILKHSFQFMNTLQYM